ncbi:MAG: hypothetical protein HY359_17150 [Candidatus Rokubacteria bacterium]|nr:hypothetical protein [Candidatus Rokubacteria bacterium]
MGESGAIPGTAAIANAVEDALADLGIVIREVPVTPVRLFALLRAAGHGSAEQSATALSSTDGNRPQGA